MAEFESSRKAVLPEHVGNVMSPHHGRKMLLAGDCTMTVVSVATGKRFTFRVERARNKRTGVRDGTIWFLSVLTGPDNESNFSYMGNIFPVADSDNMFTYRAGAKSKVGAESPAWKAWDYFYRQTQSLSLLWPGDVQVLHAGRCCVCGRKLTKPESIILGIGPECAGRE